MTFMHPWLMKELIETRVAELHRNAERQRLVGSEPLLAVRTHAGKAASSRLRRSLGRALVRAGSRVGGFDNPRTADIL
jgi:hypothetical protein